MAWDRLDASDIPEMFKLMQGIMLALTCMSIAAEIFQRIAAAWGWTEVDNTTSTLQSLNVEIAQEIKSQGNEIMGTLHDPFEAMAEAINTGLYHTFYNIELTKRAEKQKQRGDSHSNGATEDIEAEARIIKLRDADYAKRLWWPKKHR